MIVISSGCIAKITGNGTLSNIDQIGKDVYSNKTLMFEMKMPAGWKDDAMWSFPYGGVVNFVTDKYPWWPSGDDGVDWRHGITPREGDRVDRRPTGERGSAHVQPRAVLGRGDP